MVTFLILFQGRLLAEDGSDCLERQYKIIERRGYTEIVEAIYTKTEHYDGMFKWNLEDSWKPCKFVSSGTFQCRLSNIDATISFQGIPFNADGSIISSRDERRFRTSLLGAKSVKCSIGATMLPTERGTFNTTYESVVVAKYRIEDPVNKTFYFRIDESGYTNDFYGKPSF